MIILKHLTIERFRLLQEIDLHFPQRGSILISGPNEAGKSTLFESIYFALYGEPLSGPVGPVLAPAHSTLDELILYGETNATITLTISIGATELLISRTIERGKGQTVCLSVRRLGMPEEESITQLEAVNARIISELGRMDSKTLRNSCFIEQKGLTRLEYLSGSERETTLRNILGLEKLLRLRDRFKLTEHDEQLLHESAERLRLAEIQARIPELSVQLGKLEEALDTVTISEELAEITQQQSEITEQQTSLEQLATKRSEIKIRQARITQLKRANTLLSEIITAYDAIAEAQRELPELERQLADLDRSEQEELPGVEVRTRELTDLSRSFSTLERMAADLLASVNAINELEQEIQDHEHLEEDLAQLDESIIHAHLFLEAVQQTHHELEEQARLTRPQLEARLQRLQELSEHVAALSKAEEQYTQSIKQQELAVESSDHLQKVRKELQETEQELSLVEAEAEQAQQQADTMEKHWRELSIRRQLEEWKRRKELVQGLTDAEQQVMLAHQQQEQLTIEALAARRSVSIRLGLAIAGVVLFLFCGGAAVLERSHEPYIALGLGLVAILCIIGAAYNFLNYSKAQKKEQAANRHMQEAISRVGTMVAARESAMRAASDSDAGRSVEVPQTSSPQTSSPQGIAPIEREIQSLGGTVPHSLEEAEQLLKLLDFDVGAQLIAPASENLDDMQQAVTEKRSNAVAAGDQADVMREAVAALRKEVARLEEQRQQEGWNNIEEKLSSEQATIKQLRQEISTMAGQEGLPLPNFEDSRSDQSYIVGAEVVPLGLDGSSPSFQPALADTIRSTEQEIATLESKLKTLPNLATDVKKRWESLDALLIHKKALLERQERFHSQNPQQKLERTRERQATLREGLRILQDSLRQRVQALGVSFGQAAITTAEMNARKQLESLQIALGRRLELQNRRSVYLATLKESQEMLSDHYQQLAKLSSSLGSWIVPPNPFAETLSGLCTRCKRELQEANESSILRELEDLKLQEGASQAKIELCVQEIEEIHERIAALLAQRNRPPAKSYTLTSIVAVWPLVRQYSPGDRSRLEEELQTREQELRQLEQQELTISEKLQTGGSVLNLEQARKRREQQERNHQIKKQGSVLVQAVIDHLLQKMLPRTEYYMQQLLPLLTCGRYHDIRLTTDSEEETGRGQEEGVDRGQIDRAPGAFQLQVWEPAASEYIPKTALSGGTADQISLALRLAFAIAALPRELNAAPGFILLDEPLSSFDRARMQAFVDIVTGDMLGQHFEQVLLISHNSTFDPAFFPYHVYVDNGQIVESNLPTVPTPSLRKSNGHKTGEDVGVPMPASVAAE